MKSHLKSHRRIFKCIKRILIEIYNNYKMISPLTAFYWLTVGSLAQSIYPSSKINTDNISLATLQFGIILAALFTMICVWLSFLWEKNARTSIFLNFLHFCSKQFSDLAMAVAGFSSAHFISFSVYDLPAILLLGSIILATCLNHIYLVAFDEKEIGTYKLTRLLDQKNWDPSSIKVIAGNVAILAIVIMGGTAVTWLNS